MNDNDKNKPKTLKVKDKEDKNKEYELEVKKEEQTKDGKKFKNVSSGPFWQSAEMIKADNSTDKLWGKPAWLFWTTFGVGSLVLIWLLFLFFRKKKNKQEEEAL